MKTMIDFGSIIDWTSVKLTGLSVFLAVITGNKIMIALTVVSLASTILYNAIRIYKELKNKNKP